MDGTGTPRGATEIDRLLFFIAGIVMVLLVVPSVLGLAGFDIRDGSLLGDDDPPPETRGPEVLSAFGTGIDENRTSIGVVELVVGTDNQTAVQLQDVTVVWKSGQRFELTPADIDAGHGSFSVSGESALEDASDRTVLRFDVGTDDVPGVDPFGDRLEPGETVTVSIATGTGVDARDTRVLTVPDPLPAGAGVPL